MTTCEKCISILTIGSSEENVVSFMYRDIRIPATLSLMDQIPVSHFLQKVIQ